MKKIFTYILIIISIIIVLPASSIRAQEIAVSESASLRSTESNTSFDYRVENLKNFLEKFDSPLAPYAPDFVSYADTNGLDYRLVPSISGVESTFGKQIPQNSYNAYGWVNGNYSFKSWPDSIATVSSTLKNQYIDKGSMSVAQIARIYAPPSSTWGGKVQYFEGKIDPLPLNFDII